MARGLCLGVTRCVITTRNNIIVHLRETGRVVTPCPFFLPDAMLAHLIRPTCVEIMCRHDKLAHRAMAPDATTTSHPLTSQLTDAVYAGSQSPLLNPDPDPATTPAGDTSNQTPRWSVQSGHVPLLPVRFPRLLRPLSAQCV